VGPNIYKVVEAIFVRIPLSVIGHSDPSLQQSSVPTTESTTQRCTTGYRGPHVECLGSQSGTSVLGSHILQFTQKSLVAHSPGGLILHFLRDGLASIEVSDARRF